MGKEMSKNADGRGYSSAPYEIFSTEKDIEILLKNMENRKFGGKALNILKIASYFTSSIIEKGIFSPLMNNEQELREALKLLERHCLIDLYWETGVFSVKETVSERVRSYLSEKDQEKSVLQSAFKFFSESSAKEEMVLHINSVFSYAAKYPELLEEHSSTLSSVLKGLKNSNSYAEALLLATKAFEAMEKGLGEINVATMELQKELSGLCFVCDEREKSLKLLAELYRKECKFKGERKCSPTIETIVKLQMEVQKKPESEAEIRKLVFGDVPVSQTKNNSVLGVWDSYAVLLMNSDLLDVALEILEDVVKRRRELLDPDDDDIDEVNLSIAAVYLKQKEYAKGLSLLEEIVERRKARFGEFSLKVASSCELLGQGYMAKDMHEKALGVYKDVAEKLRKMTGKSILYYRALSQLGKLYFILDDFEKSYDINSELHDKLKAELGDEHDDCFSLKQNMMSCLIGQKKSSEAAVLYKEVLEWCLEKYGLVHSKTLKWCNMLEGEGISYTHVSIKSTE